MLMEFTGLTTLAIILELLASQNSGLAFRRLSYSAGYFVGLGLCLLGCSRSQYSS